MPHEWRRAPYLISTDPALIDLASVHRFLSTQAYWSKGIPIEVVRRGIEHSLTFGVYDLSATPRAQVGFARVVTDRATVAYLSDVYIEAPHRGTGLSKWLVGSILSHPDLQGLRRWMLVTADAHSLYERFGFVPPARPERYMEKLDPDIYTRLT